MTKDMHGLFMDEIHDLLSCEEQILKALPKVISTTQSPELKDAYNSHLKETKEQVKRLEKIFKLLKSKREKKSCKGTAGLIQECEEVLKEYTKPSPVRDAALISKTQRIEHYEISAYGTARTFAEELGLKEAAKLLQATLDEEGNADKKLTKIAEGGLFRAGINHKAILDSEETPREAKKAAAKKTTTKAVKKPALKATKKPAARPRKAVSGLSARKVVSRAAPKKKTITPQRKRSAMSGGRSR